MKHISRLLEHPLTRSLSVDDPRTTLLRREIIESKPFLRKIYLEWYRKIIDALPDGDHVLELGSGAGFLDTLLPTLITSEVLEVPGISLCVDAQCMPFRDHSLDAVVMTDVFHHIPDVAAFLSEAQRCLRPGGKIVMIEPWRTRWSEWVYTNMHPEPFVPEGDWTIPESGPLSGANGALPWIVFSRDRSLFESRYPGLRINGIELLMPWSYLVSGGVSMRNLMPGSAYRAIRSIEGCLNQDDWAMFAFIEIEAVR